MMSRVTSWSRTAMTVAAVNALIFGCAGPDPIETNTETRVGLPIPESPLVTIRVVFRTGSINDPEGKKGLNALTALMLGRGGTQRLSYEELTAVLYPWAASIDAQADKEVTTFDIVGAQTIFSRGN